VPDDGDGEQDAGDEAADEEPLAGAGAAHVAPCPSVPVARRQAGGFDEMPEDVDGHGAEPEDEAGLVDEHEVRPPAAPEEQQGDAARHHDDAQDDDEGTEET